MWHVQPTDAARPDSRPRHLIHIQYLRGIAAMMVVLYHILKDRTGFFAPFAQTDFGRPGVMIFFVISGFVMIHACRDEPPVTFAIRRVIRVAPLYWIMTLVYFAIVFRNDLAKGVPLQRLPDLLASLFFIPHYHTGVPDQIWPILVPGWTLNFEMFFFALVLIGILAGHVRTVTTALLLALLALGLAIPGTDPRFLTWTNPLLCLFLAGIGLAEAWPRFDFARLVALFPLGAGLVLIAALKLVPEPSVVALFYVGSVLTVAGTLAIQARWPDLRVAGLSALGDASYSIYLSHTILLIFVFEVLEQLPLTGWPQMIVTTILATLICALAGLAVYRWLERPMLNAMRRRFDPKM